MLIHWKKYWIAMNRLLEAFYPKYALWIIFKTICIMGFIHSF